MSVCAGACVRVFAIRDTHRTALYQRTNKPSSYARTYSRTQCAVAATNFVQPTAMTAPRAGGHRPAAANRAGPRTALWPHINFAEPIGRFGVFVWARPSGAQTYPNKLRCGAERPPDGGRINALVNINHFCMGVCLCGSATSQRERERERVHLFSVVWRVNAFVCVRACE